MTTNKYAVRIKRETAAENWICLLVIDVDFASADKLARKYNKSHERDESLGFAEIIKMADISRINFGKIEGRLYFTEKHDRDAFGLIKAAAVAKAAA